MAKAKNKTLVEKVLEGADKILHPENHEQGPNAALVNKETGESIDLTLVPEDQLKVDLEQQSKPKAAYKSAMGKHKKFDKFN